MKKASRKKDLFNRKKGPVVIAKKAILTNDELLIDLSNGFAIECTKILRDSTAINSVYSPFFIRNLMATVRIGTADLSALEIERGMKLFSETMNNLKIFAESMAKVMGSLQDMNQRGISLTVADRIYINRGFEISQTFATVLQNLFQAEIQQLDFKDSTETAQNINSWFEQATAGKITKVVEPTSLSGIHTRLVLLNAIHFNGGWLNKFNRRLTHKMAFHLSENKEIECDMMRRKASTLYTDLPDIGCHAAGLQFMGGQLLMIVICSKRPPQPAPQPEESEVQIDPTYRRKMAKYYGRINSELKINAILAKMVSHEMEVKLPRFTMESTTHFIQPFKQLGMRTIFDPTSANFSGITGYDVDGLFISEIIQKVVLQVEDTEEPRDKSDGKKKKRGGGPVFRPFIGGRKDPKKKKGPRSFIVDHPFVFYIVDKSNHNLILFSGLCSNPNVAVETLRPTHKYKPRSILTRELHEHYIC